MSEGAKPRVRTRSFGVAACLLLWLTGSLLPCIAVHAFNNAIAMSALAGWEWQIPLVVIGAVTLSVLLLLPLARARAAGGEGMSSHAASLHRPAPGVVAEPPAAAEPLPSASPINAFAAPTP